MQTTATIQNKMGNSSVSVDQVMLRVVESGDTKTLLKLVNCGKTSNISDMNGDPLLFMPIVNGNIEMLDTILTYGRKSTDLFDSYHVSLRKQTFSEYHYCNPLILLLCFRRLQFGVV